MTRIKKGQSALEFHAQILLEEIGVFESEYVFHPARKWRFDFANVKRKIAVEIEGGIWSGGAHTRGKGFEEDCEKYNEAALLGWQVYRFTAGMLEKGEVSRIMKAAFSSP